MDRDKFFSKCLIEFSCKATWSWAFVFWEIFNHSFNFSACNCVHPRSGAETGRTPCPKGGGQEGLPHVQGQGQWPRVPDCDGAGTAKRSYPASKVRGACREEIPSVQGQGWRREELPRVQVGAAAGRSYPTPLSLRPGTAAGRTNRTSKEPSLHQRRRA